jgi:hypothetical protein
MRSPGRLPALLFAISLFPGFAFAPRAWGASSTAVPPSQAKQAPADTMTVIPGPLRSFLRMAGISQKVLPEEILPLLARNVFAQGYEGSQDKGRPTEFLILLAHYVDQAKELAVLAGPEGVLRVATCEEAKPMLEVLGYRLRQECGQGTTTLETADPQRAFLTIDSGFPLAELERSLQQGKPFAYPYPTSPVPMLFSDGDWNAKEGANRDLIDRLLHDRGLSRLYWSMAKMDAETQDALRQSPGLKKLAPFAAVLDFYGSHICVRSGRVLVPGGVGAETGWKELVGASPDAPGEFIPRLLAKDKGWLAAYFDVLSRVNAPQQAHFTEARRLRRFYEALKEHDVSPDPARPVFRPDPGLLLLATRLRWEADGEPHVPGNLEVWKTILRQKAESRLVREWGGRAKNWNTGDQLVEAMFSLSRVQTDAGPLQVYLSLSELDGARSPEHRLRPDTVALLADRFAQFSDQYLIFSEFSALNDASIADFLKTGVSLDHLASQTLRGNALGTFQANVGIWQILARQGQIPVDKWNESWQRMIKPFAGVVSSTQLFDAGRDSLRGLLLAATGRPNASQDEIIDLLAGPQQASAEDQRMHRELANRMRSVLDGQRLVSLDALLALGDGLHSVEHVKAESDALLALAGELREFEMPRAIFSTSERYEWGPGVYDNRHTEMQMKTDLAKIIKAPGSAERLAEARGHLAPFLRDTLVGLNYAYYEPPGAQMLHNNPLFVRSHDFAGETVTGIDRVWQAPQLFGVGSPAGGGAHLVGSLADLPYALASAEQDFITPENVQALIWQEMVPGLLASAIVPRWWGVSPQELHAVALYQRAGEELLSAAVGDEQLRHKVIDILSSRMVPQRSEHVEQALRAGRLAELLPQLAPADTFYLAAEFRRNFPGQTDSWGSAGKELESLSQRYPDEISWERVSRDFGVPHPVLAQSYARELLNLEPFPAFMGYSSRLLAESWDSNNLYWARLADEQGYAPAMLNRLVPELTRRMVEKIFATDFEDWPALLRAARETGDEFRQGKIASLPTGGLVAERHN